MPDSSTIFLPLNFTQVVELANQLPENQKKQLAHLLLGDEDKSSVITTNAQKKFVRNSIKKYKSHPELLVNNEDAWKIIDTK